MCGILGIFRPGQKPVGKEDMQNLTRLLDHRGPDSSGVESLHDVAFGHTRLAILGLDEPMSAQPLNARNSLLTYNGEIYNFKEIRINLESEGVYCSERSDTETLFASLHHWGVTGTLKRLDGMFAFAFYDGEKKALYLARDRLGEKPLYWSNTVESFSFASEIKVLLATGDIRPEPNLERLNDFFHSGHINGTDTIFRGIQELPPGTCLTISEDRRDPVIEPFWALENFQSEFAPRSMDAWGDLFMEQFDNAISSRRLSDVPVGILLSGGIDSNSIAQRIMETDDMPPPFFFAESSDPETSERADVDIFLKHQKARRADVPIKLVTAKADIETFLEEHVRLTWFFDEPLVFTNSIALNAISRKARQENIKVLLSGEGSDEIFYGYDRFTRTASELSGTTERHEVYRHIYIGGGIHNADLVTRLCAGKAQSDQQTEPWKWLEKYGADIPLQHLQLLFSQKFRLLTLLHRQDRVGMSHGIECRIPFLAPKLVEWANRLPLGVKFDAGKNLTKYLLRHVMNGRLPERILTKPKDGFPSGIESWVRNGRLKPLVSRLVRDPDGFMNTYLDGRLANKIVSDYFSGETRYEVLIWRFINLEIWHRLYRNGLPSVQDGPPYKKVYEALA